MDPKRLDRSVVHKFLLTSSPFGTFSEKILLPSSSSQGGHCRLLLYVVLNAVPVLSWIEGSLQAWARGTALELPPFRINRVSKEKGGQRFIQWCVREAWGFHRRLTGWCARLAGKRLRADRTEGRQWWVSPLPCPHPGPAPPGCSLSWGSWHQAL